MADRCHWCGLHHDFKCPMVSAYDFGPDGKITRVEFVTFIDIGGELTNPLTEIPPGTTKQ